ncbi:MAG: hypothetical protein MJ239_07110 [Bacilli bacterium]|nr:hypothetical protein [Bacilli bacterium]
MSIIWLPSKKYKEQQSSKPGMFRLWVNPGPINYVAARIRKTFKREKEIESFDVKFACDTSGYLRVNDIVVFNTNTKCDYDFYNGNLPAKDFFWAKKKVVINKKKEIKIESLVELSALRDYDFSSGNGGFVLEGVINYVDGTSEAVESDESWEIRHEKQYNDPFSFNNEIENGPWEKAEVKKYKWNIRDARIKAPIEEEISFENSFHLKGKKRFFVDFPHTYAAYVEIECTGQATGKVDSFEIIDKKTKEYTPTETNHFVFSKSGKVRYANLESVGGFCLEAESKDGAELIVHVYHSHYPFPDQSKIITSNKRLNDIFDKCLFAAKNCSQNIILDSPKHCEPLGSCAGDYRLISFVNAFATGDYDLAKHVLRGYTNNLYRNGGQNANDDYALIVTIWLHDIYMMTGDKELLKDCLKGIEATDKRYSSFVGEKGIVDHPRRYCFIDWLNVDGYGLFSAPANLGQSVVNMFYYRHLVCLSYIYEQLGDEKKAKRTARKAKKLKKAINANLYDKERGLYSEGLNEDVGNYEGCQVPPGNGKKYFRKHANALAVAYGLTSSKKQSKAILKKIFTELNDCEMQPYFMHYLFEAVHKADMDGKYAKTVLKYWLDNVKTADKGLPEGFYKPEPSYKFDYSHAWACTPYYSFIIATSGINILEPGMKKIAFSPRSLKVKEFSYKIFTPYGPIFVSLSKNQKIEIIYPKEIEIVK